MKKKNSVLRKVLAVALSAVTLLGTGFTTAGQFVGTSISVSATQVYGDFEYEVNNDNTVTITKYTGNGGDVVIPDIIDGKSVTKIGESAFYYCIGLTSITIPDSVTSIGNRAFFVTGLKSVAIPKNVTSIGELAFESTDLISITVDKNNKVYSSDNGILFNKDKTEIIRFPRGKKGTYLIPDSVISIKEYAFSACRNLTNIVIPDSVTSIKYYAFEGCRGLTNITIPNSVTSIDGGLFRSCTGLTNITIPNSVTQIFGGVFFDCTSLTSITIPDSVTKIYESTFYGCTGLTSIMIPDSVTSIGYRAFSGCKNLTIYGVKGSYAETYAKENDIPFVSEYSNVSAISSDEILLGGTVTVNAKAVLGDGDYTYAVLYKKKADTKWTVKQNYSTNDTIVVKPAKATDYDVCVKVKDSTGKIVKKFFEVKVNAKLKNTSTISATTIKKGNTVTLNGSATGGMGGYTYAVLYKKKAETKWTVRQNYNTNSEILVRPYTNTDYDICIKVKDKDGTIVKKYFTVTVTK